MFFRSILFGCLQFFGIFFNQVFSWYIFQSNVFFCCIFNYFFRYFHFLRPSLHMDKKQEYPLGPPHHTYTYKNQPPPKKRDKIAVKTNEKTCSTQVFQVSLSMQDLGPFFRACLFIAYSVRKGMVHGTQHM